MAIGVAPAQADPVVGFDAGHIIDDALFYDGNAMTVSQVQTFLNQRVSRCLIGTPPYIPGNLSPSGSGNIIANSCLKDFRMNTTSRPADAYCAGYAGRANESAAQIIAKVGRACGISQKVLLVMLEKEQSLLSDSWPVTRQYNYAMGMNCPDSGPGNSANCNSDTAGFYLQMLLGARQLKVYKGNPNSFNYKPFQYNTIQYHPDRDRCGTSQVYIENWATAALYIYTPYRPNQAALNAGWGEGNSCSSYGNRNFYNFYKQWFGPPNSSSTMSPGIRRVYNEAIAAGRPYGDPVGAMKRISANGGGYQMEFENGIITESTAKRVSVGIRKGNFTTGYLASGGAAGPWGFAMGDPTGVTSEGTRELPMQNGKVLYTYEGGIQFLPNSIYNQWYANGERSGTWGLPTSDRVALADRASSVSFENGVAVLSRQYGVSFTTHEAYDDWIGRGGPLGNLVAPNGDAVRLADGGSYQQFARHVVFYAADEKFTMANGGYTTRYLDAGGPDGSWGWPAGPREYFADRSSVMPFENGTAVHSAATGVVWLEASLYQDWVERGANQSPTGFPSVDSQMVDGGGAIQEYAKQTVFARPDGETFAIANGGFPNEYFAAGGPTGSWGWPASERVYFADRSSTVAFENGVAMHSGATGVVFISSDAHADWVARGAERSATGFPVAETVEIAGGFYQEYARMFVFVTPSGESFSIAKGKYIDEYFAAGGPDGAWGWPISDRVYYPQGGGEIAFENGVAIHDSANGTVTFESN